MYLFQIKGISRRGQISICRFFASSHHGSNLIKALQELHNLRLVGRFHSGKAASLSDGVLLIIWREVIKLTTSEGLVSDILILSEDTNATTDGHSCAFVVT